MLHRYSREELLIGEEGLNKLRRARVAVFGIGGVGGYVVEALARSGVGALDLFDGDTVALTNINRQIIADHSTVGRLKTEVMREHLLLINPHVSVEVHPVFFLPGDAEDFLNGCDYLVDAVDTVSAKLRLAEIGQERGIPVISAMGAGNKLDPTRFEVADITETSVCPLCRVMRRELKKRGIAHLKVVYSREPPLSVQPEEGEREAKGTAGRTAPGILAFVPSVAGLILASQVIRDLTEGLRPEAVLC